jgi:ribose transport system ATP-binding protein
MNAAAVDLPVIDLHGISKTFSGVTVLHSVSLQLMAGEVHGLVGMNGSGKSTLIKILAGVHKPDPGGVITFPAAAVAVAGHGAPRRSHRALLRRESREVRIGFVHQDVGLVDTFSIVDNFALSLGYDTTRIGGVRRRRIAEVTEAGLRRVGVAAAPDTEAGRLGAADRTLVAIARALTLLAGEARPCLVVDEPTAALPQREVNRVLGVLRTLSDEGAAVLFVSHNLGEIAAVTHRVTVLRDGRIIDTAPTASLSQAQIIDRMLGERVEHALLDQIEAVHEAEERAATHPAADQVPTLRVSDLCGDRADHVSFDIAPGEILVLTGLVGCGKSEIGRVLAGSNPPRSGRLELAGQPYSPASPRDAVASGISYVPAERLRNGGILTFTARENISLPVLERFWHRGRVGVAGERAATLGLMDATRVTPMAPEQPFGAFSGGNQQKIVLSRALISRPRLLVIDEPTQGVDVGAIPVLYDRIRAAAAGGAAVLVITSSYEEAEALGERAVVLDRGVVCAELSGDQLSVPALAAAGLQSGRTAPAAQGEEARG